MISQVEAAWSRIESSKRRTLEIVGALDLEAQNRPLTPKGWSPLQIVQHLILAEEAMIGEMQAAVVQGAYNRKPSRSPAYRLLLWVLRKGVRVPAAPTMIPELRLPLEILVERWSRVRKQVQEHLEGVGIDRPDAPISVHPMMGPLSAAQVMEITEAHLQYHLRQLEPLRRATQVR